METARSASRGRAERTCPRAGGLIGSRFSRTGSCVIIGFNGARPGVQPTPFFRTDAGALPAPAPRLQRLTFVIPAPGRNPAPDPGFVPG